MDLAADVSTMTSGDFAIDATVAGGAVRGIYDANYASMDNVLTGSSPALLLAASAVSAAIGDPVTLGGQSFRVTGVEPDIAGLVLLRLEKR